MCEMRFPATIWKKNKTYHQLSEPRSSNNDKHDKKRARTISTWQDNFNFNALNENNFNALNENLSAACQRNGQNVLVGFATTLQSF